ncbi:Phospholipid-transporting ATPase DNF1 [Drechslerella dactyloides]|uniref:Phospholipid-transporting ATPase n=1 Tax=Drechslerella dactyloides TaxID=74499 RepID=A0AAD6NJV3_DREDA|nr:Phospholipid-transporting ATPase DNF1 [Drechslerella dactyloides]
MSAQPSRLIRRSKRRAPPKKGLPPSPRVSNSVLNPNPNPVPKSKSTPTTSSSSTPSPTLLPFLPIIASSPSPSSFSALQPILHLTVVPVVPVVLLLQALKRRFALYSLLYLLPLLLLLLLPPSTPLLLPLTTPTSNKSLPIQSNQIPQLYTHRRPLRRVRLPPIALPLNPVLPVDTWRLRPSALSLQAHNPQDRLLSSAGNPGIVVGFQHLRSTQSFVSHRSSHRSRPVPIPFRGVPGARDPGKKITSLFGRKEEKGDLDEAEQGKASAGQTSSESGESDDINRPPARNIYVNVPLPENEADEEGKPLAQYARNKIRTAKYTPLSFVPKNLWLQFHNVANIYFLFITILQIFSIFGASNPELGCIPLVAILLITGIKDAIEDYRRTILDLELNNTPVHILLGVTNVNATDDQISLWRQIKKASSRGLRAAFHFLKSLRKKDEGSQGGAPKGLQRMNTRASIYTIAEDVEAIQMTPVPSPAAPHGQFSFPSDQQDGGAADSIRPAPTGSSPTKGKISPSGKFYGSVVDPRYDPKEQSQAKFKRDNWKNVQVGDWVRIYNNEEVPADVVILATSDSDGACYVETKNLDGETNLKARHAMHCGAAIRHARDCERAKFTIESEGPHANLYSYNGLMKWDQLDPNGEGDSIISMTEPITVNNLLLRGCSLRNTDWAVGVVIFTGSETKIMMNAGITPTKRSRIQRELNFNVLMNFIILFVMCLLSGIVQGVFSGKKDASQSFFEYGSIGGSPGVDGLITFWTAVILFQTLVPVSLYISLEIIKTAQAFFIFSDILMYYEPLDYPCTPKSWNISDDVGQIEYIFSDKTGTLTQNVMEFKKCTINGRPYGEAYTEAFAGIQKRQGVNVDVEGPKAKAQIAADKKEMIKNLRQLDDNEYLEDERVTFVAPDFVKDLTGANGDAQAAACHHFMLALALCHSVLPDVVSEDPPRIEFKAQSPDEAALVATARDMGFSLVERTQSGVRLNVHGKMVGYQVLNTLEFNSARKRMSAIIRMPDDKIILFCKGADSIIYSRLAPDEQQDLRKTTAEHLEVFAREGLRTLCIAERVLSEEEYREWMHQYDAAISATVGRDEKVEEVSDMIEQNLTLLGGTAIEDRLQDGVPDSIALLGEAGIKLWVLTGDKVETAINIGFSCNLLNNEMDLILLQSTESTIEAAHAMVLRYLREHFDMQGGAEELALARKNHDPPPPTHAVIIDGDTLRLVLNDAVKNDFLLLCKQCRAVLCCRVSPSQKAAVVRMVKVGLDVMTLAIGDGANDVAMIQEADVGVGIAGEEGRQAAMSSDYAIGQFRFLCRLVLVHGRWSYRRLAEMIANFFYKMLMTKCHWLFPNYTNEESCGSSGHKQNSVVVNVYVLMNQYRWDYLFVGIVAFSILLIWFWTGVYSQFMDSVNFYKSAEQVYGALSFWVNLLITVVVSLLPRFACKVVQKLYFPYDIDIIREQVRQGKFRYLYETEEGTVALPRSSESSAFSNLHKSRPSNPFASAEDDERPMYPPSIAPTATTAGKRESHHGSDGTESDIFAYPPHRFSMDERPRNSFERIRASMDRTRASFEASNDFTSAAMLARVESRNSIAFSRRRSGLATEYFR